MKFKNYFSHFFNFNKNHSPQNNDVEDTGVIKKEGSLTNTHKAPSIPEKNLGHIVKYAKNTAQFLLNNSINQNSIFSEIKASNSESKNFFSFVEQKVESTATASVDAQEKVRNGLISISNLSDSIGALNQVSESIGKFMELLANATEKLENINDIAVQSRIISLNASIEANRAGEHGRTFAIVAKEMENLSTDTGRITKEVQTEIGESIAAIKDMTATIPHMIKSSTDLVHETKDELEVSFKDIFNLLSDIGNMQNSFNEYSASAQKFNATIERFKEVTDSLGTAASNVKLIEMNLNDFIVEGEDKIHETPENDDFPHTENPEEVKKAS